MKYEKCSECGQKPKVYKVDFNGEWNLDHDCLHIMGSAYLGGECKSDVVKAWNSRVAANQADKAERSRKVKSQ